MDRDEFIKPKTIHKGIYVIVALCEEKREIFCLSKVEIYSLTHDRTIKFEGQKLVNATNFSFGQSEVFIRSNGQLVLNRKNKCKALTGNIPDGTWDIHCYY